MEDAMTSKERHAEILRLIRDEFDPKPPNWDSHYGDWFDNAEDVANKIEALFALAALEAKP